jgi:uncharacterized Zn finger protein
MNTLHLGEIEGWTCWNCGLVVKNRVGFPERVSRGERYPCRWCGNVSTRLISEPGRTERGVWQVLQCTQCGATHAHYLRAD